MQFCPRCGSRITGAGKFCTSCGFALQPAPVEVAAREEPPQAPQSPGQRSTALSRLPIPRWQVVLRVPITIVCGAMLVLCVVLLLGMTLGLVFRDPQMLHLAPVQLDKLKHGEILSTTGRIAMYSSGGEAKWWYKRTTNDEIGGRMEFDMGKDGRVFAASPNSRGIVVLNAKGAKIKTIAPKKFGGEISLAALRSGDVLVSDTKNHRLVILGGDGAVRKTAGGKGSAPGRFFSPGGVAELPDGSILVADAGNYRIQRLNPDLTPAQTWKNPRVLAKVYEIAGDGKAPARRVSGKPPSGCAPHRIASDAGQGLIFVSFKCGENKEKTGALGVFSEGGEFLGRIDLKDSHGESIEPDMIRASGETGLLAVVDSRARRAGFVKPGTALFRDSTNEGVKDRLEVMSSNRGITAGMKAIFLFLVVFLLAFLILSFSVFLSEAKKFKDGIPAELRSHPGAASLNGILMGITARERLYGNILLGMVFLPVMLVILFVQQMLMRSNIFNINFHSVGGFQTIISLELFVIFYLLASIKFGRLFVLFSLAMRERALLIAAPALIGALEPGDSFREAMLIAASGFVLKSRLMVLTGRKILWVEIPVGGMPFISREPGQLYFKPASEIVKAEFKSNAVFGSMMGTLILTDRSGGTDKTVTRNIARAAEFAARLNELAASGGAPPYQGFRPGAQ